MTLIKITKINFLLPGLGMHYVIMRGGGGGGGGGNTEPFGRLLPCRVLIFLTNLITLISRIQLEVIAINAISKNC